MECCQVEFSELIERRKSVRKYKSDPVPREAIIKVLEAARIPPPEGTGSLGISSSSRTRG